MIGVERTGTPAVLNTNAAEWLHTYMEAIANLATIPESPRLRRRKEAAESLYRHEQIRQGLKDMFSSKCAYCESEIEYVAYPHIEHFKPKSLYPEFCFSWENLMLACPRCNHEKRDFFPQENEGGPFINPTREDPNDFFLFEYDQETGTANVIPKENSPRASVTIERIGLNRPELVKRRSKFIRELTFIAIKASEGDEEALDLLRYHILNGAEYAAFVRVIIHRLQLNIPL